MRNSHLTDEVLQSFLLNETKDENINTHLSGCADCRAKLESYQRLATAFQELTPDSFQFDITPLVMDRIVHYEQQENKKQELIFWGSLSLSILVISIVSVPFLSKALTVFYAIPIFKTLLIVGTGLAVVLILIADLIKQYKLKERKIFEDNLQPIL